MFQPEILPVRFGLTIGVSGYISFALVFGLPLSRLRFVKALWNQRLFRVCTLYPLSAYAAYYMVQLNIDSYLSQYQGISTRASPLSLGLAGLTSGHAAIWSVMLCFIFAVFLADLLLRRKFNPVKPVLLMGLIAGLHELTWYASWFASARYPLGLASMLALHYLPFIAVMTEFVLVAFLVYPKESLLIVKYAYPALVGYYALWLWAGFQTTLNLTTGPTQYYGNVLVDFIESGSWEVPTVIGLCTMVYYVLSTRRYDAKQKA